MKEELANPEFGQVQPHWRSETWRAAQSSRRGTPTHHRRPTLGMVRAGRAGEMRPPPKESAPPRRRPRLRRRRQRRRRCRTGRDHSRQTPSQRASHPRQEDAPPPQQGGRGWPASLLGSRPRSLARRRHRGWPAAGCGGLVGERRRLPDCAVTEERQRPRPRLRLRKPAKPRATQNRQLRLPGPVVRQGQAPLNPSGQARFLVGHLASHGVPPSAVRRHFVGRDREPRVGPNGVPDGAFLTP